MVKTRSFNKTASVASEDPNRINKKKSLENLDFSSINIGRPDLTKDSKNMKEKIKNLENIDISNIRPTKRKSSAVVQVDLNLFTCLSVKNAEINKTVKNWYKCYKKSHINGIRIFLQLFFDSINSSFEIKKAMVSKPDPSVFMRKIQKDEEKIKNILDKDLKELHYLKINIPNFIGILINYSKNDLIYDGKFLDTIIIWFKALSDSSLRAVRIASVIFILNITKSLLKIHSDITRTLENKPEVKLKSQSSQLNKSFSIIQDHSETIETLVETILCEIFDLRYRDILSDIRSLCIESLGDWILISPNFLLNNNTLKYVGWMLNDRINSVRLKCATVLLKLVQNCDLKKMKQFLGRYKKRIIEMCYDISDEIGCVSLQTCHLLNKHIKISSDQLDKIYLLMYSDSSKLGRNAASLFIDSIDPNESQNKFSSIPLIIKLAEFHLKNFGLPHDNLISSIYDHCVEFSPKVFMRCVFEICEQGIDDDTESCIFILLKSYICHFFSKLSNNKKITIEIENNKQIFDDFLNQALFDWLNKYSNESIKLIHILDLCFYIDLQVLNPSRFEILNKLIMEIVYKSINSKVIKKAASVIENFSNKAPSKFSSIINETINSLFSNYISLLNEKSFSYEDDTVRNSLHKLSCLSRYLDTTNIIPDHTLTLMLTNLSALSEYKVVKNTLGFILLHLSWSHLSSSKSEKNMDDFDNIPEEFIKRIIELYKYCPIAKRACFHVLSDFLLLHTGSVSYTKMLEDINEDLVSLSRDFLKDLLERIENQDDYKDTRFAKDLSSVLKLVTLKQFGSTMLLFPLVESFTHMRKNYEDIVLKSLAALFQKRSLVFYNLVSDFLKNNWQNSSDLDCEYKKLIKIASKIVTVFSSSHDDHNFDRNYADFHLNLIEFIFSIISNQGPPFNSKNLSFLEIISCFNVKLSKRSKELIFNKFIKMIEEFDLNGNIYIIRYLQNLSMVSMYNKYKKSRSTTTKNNIHPENSNLIIEEHSSPSVHNASIKSSIDIVEHNEDSGTASS